MGNKESVKENAKEWRENASDYIYIFIVYKMGNERIYDPQTTLAPSKNSSIL